MDSSFIMQELGLKYLRNRMMIEVDVDGLSTEVIGHLMPTSVRNCFDPSPMRRRVQPGVPNTVAVRDISLNQQVCADAVRRCASCFRWRDTFRFLVG